MCRLFSFCLIVCWTLSTYSGATHAGSATSSSSATPAGGATNSSGTTQAAECATKSPLFERLGDAYYTFDHQGSGAESLRVRHDNRDSSKQPVSFARQDWSELGLHISMTEVLDNRSHPHYPLAASLLKMLETLHNTEFRRGTGERIVCSGRNSEAPERLARFQLEGLERVTLLSGQIMLNAWEDDDNKRVVKSQSIDIPAISSWQASDTFDSLQVHQRLRRSGAVSCCSYLVEIHTEARSRHNRIELKQTFYVNGYRSDWVLWRLEI